MAIASIIIPAYNVSRYITRCIESVRQQTCADIEIIIIDDGSTDSTGELSDQFSAQDERITVIHQMNQGTLKARKSGIKKATGKYVFFVDSDDWIERNMIEVMVKKASINDSEIVFAGVVRENEDLITIKKDVSEEKVYDESNLALFYRTLFGNEDEDNTGVFLSVCSKCIKTDIVKKVFETEIESTRLMEDTSMILASCVWAQKVTLLSDAFYHYCMRYDSATHKKNEEFLCDINKMYSFVKKQAINSKYRDVFLEGFDVFFVDQCVRGLSLFYDLYDEAHFPYYIFPDSIPNGADLIIYGAGRVGESYYRQFLKDPRVTVKAIIDKRYSDIFIKGIPIIGIDSLDDYDYDYIVIAVRFKEMARRIENELKHVYGVDENKVIWRKPEGVLDKYIRNS